MYRVHRHVDLLYKICVEILRWCLEQICSRCICGASCLLLSCLTFPFGCLNNLQLWYLYFIPILNVQPLQNFMSHLEEIAFCHLCQQSNTQPRMQGFSTTSIRKSMLLACVLCRRMESVELVSGGVVSCWSSNIRANK